MAIWLSLESGNRQFMRYFDRAWMYVTGLASIMGWHEATKPQHPLVTVTAPPPELIATQVQGSTKDEAPAVATLVSGLSAPSGLRVMFPDEMKPLPRQWQWCHWKWRVWLFRSM